MEPAALDFDQSADPALQEIVGGRYLLLEKLRDESYLARDLGGTLYRLRVDYHHRDEEWSRARLERSKLDLSHPNLVPYTDFGVNPVLSWRVGPHLAGSTLRDLLKKGCADAELVRKFMLDGLSGLGALHSESIIYENWAAENLVFHENRWVLQDVGWTPDMFPNACVNWTEHPSMRDLHVIAPERLTGSSRIPASDYFALGSWSYVLLSGQSPFGENVDVMATLLKILTQAPLPLDEVVPDVPEKLAQAIDILLAKDPEERDVFTVQEHLAGPKTARTASSEFSNYLSGVRAAGKAEDNSGVFTLDPSLALSKLKSFQFFGPHDFLIPLFASCLSSGVSELKVEANSRGFKLSHPSSPFTGEELKLLFVAACGGGGTSLSKLGLAVTGALAAGATKVELSSGPHHLKLHRLEQPQVTTGRDGGFSIKIHGEMVGKAVPALLEERVRFSPVPIRWNGTRLDVREESFTAKRSVDGVEFMLETSLASEWPGLFLRADGLSYRKQERFLLPGVRMVLGGPWKTDLSFRNLVADKRHKTLIEEAKDWLLQIASQDALERPYTASRSNWYEVLLNCLNTEDEVDKIHLHIVRNTPYPPPERDDQVERSCNYVYENRLEEWPKACRILVLPTYLDSRPWPDLKRLALDAYEGESDQYWLFLLQAFIKFQNFEPSRVEVRELLSRVHLIPEEDRSLWDHSLHTSLSKLIGRLPYPSSELREEWLGLIPAQGFYLTRNWLSRLNDF